MTISLSHPVMHHVLKHDDRFIDIYFYTGLLLLVLLLIMFSPRFMLGKYLYVAKSLCIMFLYSFTLCFL